MVTKREWITPIGAYQNTIGCRHCSFVAFVKTKPPAWSFLKKPFTKKQYRQLFTQSK